MHFETCHQIAHSRVNKRQYPWVYTPRYGMQQPKGSLCLATQVHRTDGCAECGIQWPSFGRARELQVPQKSNTTGPLDHTGNWFLCYLSLSNLVSLSEQPCFPLKYHFCLRSPIPESIHSFHSLSYNRSTVSSKASPPHSAIECFRFQFPVSARFLKVIQ